MSPFGWWKIQVLDELKDDIKFTSRIICASHNMDDEQSSALILQLEGPASGALAGLQTRAIKREMQSRCRGH